MAGLSGDESPMPPNRQRNGEHGEGLMNGDTGVTSGQLTSELRNLVSILGRQSDNGISLEQLLSGASPTRNLATSTSSLSHQIPTTPSSSRSSSWGGRKRGRPFDSDESTKRRRVMNSYSAKPAGEKSHQGKGLRHFSQRVCEKVRQKGNTTYNEVADELVKELSESERKSHGSNDVPIDHKNIRRRVYDALNVLMAMNIISKEKKDIRWIGLPTNSVQECQHIEEEVSQAEQRIQTKRNKVEELIVQILSYKNLMKRNRERVSSLGAPAQNSAIGLPFIIVNTSRSTTIDCSISSDKSEYVFSFDNAFELHNDIDILKKMGLDCGIHSGACSADGLKLAKSMLPKAFGDTLDEIVSSKTVPVVEDTPLTPSAAANQPPVSYCSTPSTTLSPSLTPFATPTAASSPHVAAIAAVLAQAAAANNSNSGNSQSPMGGNTLQQQLSSSPLSLAAAGVLQSQQQQQQFSSPMRSASNLLPNNIASTSFGTPPPTAASPCSTPHLSTLSSPTSSFFSDTTPTNNNGSGSTQATDRSKVVPIATKTLLSSPLTVGGSKSVLHHHATPIPQPAGTSSPLVKSSLPTGSIGHQQLTSPRMTLSSSPGGARSPAAKFVTASKVSNEQFTSLLQQLHQNPSISRLLSAAALHTNGNGTS